MPLPKRFIYAIFTSILFAGCTNQAFKQTTPQIASDHGTEIHTLTAEYYCKDGKVGIRLIGTSRIRELDEIILKFLIDISDPYPNLKEGETLPYPADKLKLLEANVTGK